MKLNLIVKKASLLLVLAACTFSVRAQGWGGWGGESGGTMGGGGTFIDSTSNGAAATEVAAVKYERFMPPYDTLREVIFYEGVIEDENCEFCNADSLYLRAKKFLGERFGKEKVKEYMKEDKKFEKLYFIVRVPMVIKRNTYNKQESGTLEYRMTLRFKDGRYKYQFGNFVHESSLPGPAVRTSRTYHEYYMKVKKGYQFSDLYLLAGDREVKEVVAGLKKTLRDPFQPDEDDW